MLGMEEYGGAFDEWRGLILSPEFSLPPVSDSVYKKEKIDPSIHVINNNNNNNDDRNVEEDDENNRVEDSRRVLRGSIAERRAEKCGFNASRINVVSFRSTSPLASPRSPYVTIPPGISPTSLLDSPVMLHNSQAQPSPTTGTFPFPPLNHKSLMMNSVTPAADGDLVSIPFISGLGNQPPMDLEFPAEFPKGTVTKKRATDSSEEVSKNMILNADCSALQPCHTAKAGNQMQPINEDVMEEHQKGAFPPTAMVRTSEDGYNWRKYGQKQVKGSEYPRSYYKCTHPNCQVKKILERSHDGQITEIIYKGAHNHPIPQPSRRTMLGSPVETSEISEGNGSCVKVEGGSVWRNIQLGCKDIKVGSDWRADGLERTSSTSVVTDVSDPLSNTQGKSMGVFESVELSSTLASHDGVEEDGATQGSVDDADESESKRRKKDSCITASNFASRAMREPRVVVQIESEVDILEDGYRWRKYGQKVVKGNPNPRSYYKCTSAGCLVRKHVERASHNLKSVITTYEGKHNHEVPAAKNSSSHGPPPASNTHPTLTLPGAANVVPKPEAQVQEIGLHFERKPEFLRPTSSMLGNFGGNMQFGASSSIYPYLQNSMSYGSFLMNETHPACSVVPVVPDYPILLSMRSANMALGGDFDISSTIGPLRSFLGGQQQQQLKENNDIRFIKPKQEEEEVEDDNQYANASSSMFS